MALVLGTGMCLSMKVIGNGSTSMMVVGIIMNKSESKYFNTALLMDEALIKLLAEKNIEFISIKEICEKAGVNRSTFYLHYETIGGIQ